MSRIAKQPITIPAKTTVTQDGEVFTVKGPKGELTRIFKKDIGVEIKENEIVVSLIKENLFTRGLWGTYASHFRNMITGVNEGFEKKLTLEGVGYRASVNGKVLEMSLGFSHPVRIDIPEGLTVVVEKSQITISGADKELVGSFTAGVRSKKKPEPYKGKGIRYIDEVIRRKQGKKSA